MREYKFRIVYQHGETGRLAFRLITLGEVIPYLGERWSVVSKDQYTGVIDTLGRDICEGDIVKHVTHQFNGVVFFERGCFWVRECLSHVDAGLYHDIEKETRWSIDLEWQIVGNQYENPELIQVKL